MGAGFRSFLDFIGYPVGAGAAVPQEITGVGGIANLEAIGPVTVVQEAPATPIVEPRFGTSVGVPVSPLLLKLRRRRKEPEDIEVLVDGIANGEHVSAVGIQVDAPEFFVHLSGFAVGEFVSQNIQIIDVKRERIIREDAELLAMIAAIEEEEYEEQCV